MNGIVYFHIRILFTRLLCLLRSLVSLLDSTKIKLLGSFHVKKQTKMFKLFWGVEHLNLGVVRNDTLNVAADTLLHR